MNGGSSAVSKNRELVAAENEDQRSACEPAGAVTWWFGLTMKQKEVTEETQTNIARR